MTLNQMLAQVYALYMIKYTKQYGTDQYGQHLATVAAQYATEDVVNEMNRFCSSFAGKFDTLDWFIEKLSQA